MAATEEGLGLQNWQFISNIHHCHLCRIMVGWNPARVTVSTIHMDSQWVTCDVLNLEDSSTIMISFIYGLHTLANRMPL